MLALLELPPPDLLASALVGGKTGTEAITCSIDSSERGILLSETDCVRMASSGRTGREVRGRLCMSHLIGFSTGRDRRGRACTKQAAALPAQVRFTLVELLVVITIIGILIALVAAGRSGAPANRAAGAVPEQREATRPRGVAPRASRPLAAHRRLGLPSGGRTGSRLWPRQSRAAQSIIACPTWSSRPSMTLDWASAASTTSATKQTAAVQIDPDVGHRADLPRRAARACSTRSSRTTISTGQCAPPTHLVPTDYAINAGSVFRIWRSGPGSYQSGFAAANSRRQQPEASGRFSDMRNTNGITAQTSTVRINEITDGTTHTYLWGEEVPRPRRILHGQRSGRRPDDCDRDNDNMNRWTGNDSPPSSVSPCRPRRTCRATLVPIPSARPRSGFNMAFRDGSVQKMNFTIDPETHRRLGTATTA